MPHLDRLLTALAAASLLSACAPPQPWHGTEVGEVMPALAFELTDSSGAPVTEADFRGRTTLLFFGFTNCPGPCPTTLGRLGAALEAMEHGDSAQVLMVSVDPDRDSPQALSRYEKSFGPWLHGLTGDPAALDALRQSYRVHAQKLLPDAAGAYDVAHGTAVYAFDAGGHCRLLFSDVSDTAAVAADLDRLAEEGAPG